ncbi:MAG: CoA transferase [Candidatus Tectomicrobia bacterium]|uniref:CoA transferase n=1 Tax=Tectimicrobiota bacterium TaxID=2528274 RepID=A0A937W486_UNCTE|nr:CoA transferase [Candidatus Tectomicrobia bacterium]
MSKPLQGVKVLDMTRVLAGPYCTMMLGDMGADVVKVERPEAGDDTRGYGPPFVNGESAYFMSINRNKRSLTLNLKHPEALTTLRRLIETADVLVENFRPGTMESFGYGYETVQELNPRLIFCSISGFGHTGPKAELPGYDLIIQGEGGVASLTGDPNGPPYKVGNSQADVVAGMMAFQSILLALIARGQTGRGQKVDLSMLDCQVAMLTYQAGIYFATGQSPTRMGNQHPTITPYETFRCKDGYINVACGNDGMWRSLCKAAGHDDWGADERFRTNADRVQNRRALSSILEPAILEKTMDEWIALLRVVGIPCGKIQSVGEICEDPQIIARDMVVTVEHPKAGPMRVTGVPLKLSETPGAVTLPPPLLGEHTGQVLTDWLQLSTADVDHLRQVGAL